MTVRQSVVFSAPYQQRSGYTGAFTTYNLTFLNRTNILFSQNHPDWKRKVDGGGPFASVKTTYKVSPAYANTSRLVGPWVNTIGPGTDGNYAYPILKTNADLNQFGTTAIARSLPTNPAAELSVAMGEVVHEGLPKMIGSQAFKDQVHAAHKAGGEYLNWQFGWQPLVSSLKDFAHAVKRRHEIMDGYVKFSDKQIRRRYLFPVQEGNRTGELGSSVYAGNLSTDHPIQGTWNQSYKTELWFSGAFKYHIPVGNGFFDKAAYYQAEASKILGLELTPEVVWNLAPWSWAVDWFSNTGDVIHNISRLGKDGLVMRYGYIMNHNTVTREVSSYGRGPYAYNRLLAGQNTYFQETYETKQRLPATPYGFGLSYDGLSNT